jgi:pyruvate dehydrogenase E2 component (dihydrolipoamide acetyltransferase)
MAHVLIMPRQGNTVESCIIGEWKVKEGDTVQADTPVCVVETDKATFEVPAGEAGTVLKLLHQTGDDVPVLQPIMVVGKPGEEWQSLVQGNAESAGREQKGEELKAKEDNAPASGTGVSSHSSFAGAEGQKLSAGASTGVSPRAKKLAWEEAIDIRALDGSGPGGRIIARDVEQAAAGRPPLTRAAKDELRKKIAAGLGLVSETGSGLGGRITASDLAAAPFKPASSAQAQCAGANIADEFEDAPVKGIRKVIADSMMTSHNTTAAFTLNSSAPAVNLQGLRARFKASAPQLGLNKITINDLVLFAASRVLPLYSYMNAHKLNGTVRTFKNVHLGCAVSTPRGLMVPVIRNADKLSLLQISQKAKELAEACRGGSVSPDDLHGSTFTVTNLGNTGIESFSPVINIPEVAILGVCSIIPKPAETSPGHYDVLPCLGFSLTIDHAVVDGAPAAEFLKAMCGAIKEIDLWLAK